MAAQLSSRVLERGVVGGQVDLCPAGGPHGGDVALHEAVVDVRVAEADGQIAPTIAGGDHEPPAQALERDVPEPRRIAAVGDAGVDADDDGEGSGADEIEGFGPARRVLGTEEA